jgi:dTDP-4-amino-4,6-dideoxygalactose transaminase
MDPVLQLAREKNLRVVEDAAQAILAEDRGRQAGTMGDLGCFSFFPTKNLGCDGDGGMVVADDDQLAEKIRVLRVHGSHPEYVHRMVGINSRLDTIQAAILLAKMPGLDEWTTARIRNAANYRKLFKAAGLGACVRLPEEPEGRRHVYNQFVVRVERRDELFRHLTEHGIGCRIYYPVPIHLQQCFAFLGYKRGDFPVAEKLAECSLALPIYPELKSEQQKRVVAAIADFYS